MKKLIAAVLMLAAVPAWAEPCRVYEYAEMKDMTDAELQTELDATTRMSQRSLEQSNKWGALGVEREAQRSFDDSVACRKQHDRLWAVKTKRTGTPARRTYAECKAGLEALGADSSVCEQFKEAPRSH